MTYAGLAFPKPKARKGNSRKAKNNPVPTIYDRCIICGRPYASLHEVFGGRNRQNSIDWKMQVRLCNEVHHLEVTINPKGELATSLKKEYQRKFESEYGHEKFIGVFGRNYL